MKLLLVDADRDMVEILGSWLKMQGYEVCHAYTAERARREWIEHSPDLVICDHTLKDVDALAACHELQTKHDALLLILSTATDMEEEVRCLEAGADDYLRKPFFPRQLLARIHALTRRSRVTLSLRPSSIIRVGPLSVDSMRNQTKVYERMVRLTPIETKLLLLLAANADTVCTLEQIVEHVWGYDDGDTYLIKAHIRHLREKLETNPSRPRFILTVAGVGYSLARLSDEEGVAAQVASAREPVHLEALPSRISLEGNGMIPNQPRYLSFDGRPIPQDMRGGNSQ